MLGYMGRLDRERFAKNGASVLCQVCHTMNRHLNTHNILTVASLRLFHRLELPTLAFCTSTMSHYGSTFSVAGMSSSTSSHHNPNLNNWGNSNTGSGLGSSTLGTSSFGDSLSQSRSHYQSGYLMVRFKLCELDSIFNCLS